MLNRIRPAILQVLFTALVSLAVMLGYGAVKGLAHPSLRTDSHFPPSGGGTTYTAGAGIAISSGVISATSGFSAHINLATPNAVSAPISTLDLLNGLSVNTAGSETAYWLATFPVGGTQIVGDLWSLNMAGKFPTTTSGSAPTVAFPPRTSTLEITVGATATKLLVTGLDLASDQCYEVDYYIPTSPGAEMDLKLNDTDPSAQLKGIATGASSSIFTLTALWLTDNRSPVDGKFRLCDRGTSLSKTYAVRVWDGSLQGDYFGHSGLNNANVTSFSMNNVPINSRFWIKRALASAY